MLFAVLVSFGSGITNVVARICNAGLSDETSPVKSTFYNYVVGLVCSLAVLLSVGGAPAGRGPTGTPFWAYLGGLLGLGAVVLSNVTVSKLSAFTITLLMFVGQVFTGVLLDAALTGTFSMGNLLGGLLVAAGLAVTLLVDRKDASYRQEETDGTQTPE